jgi:hypothetical protein
MYSGKIAVPPGGGGIREIIINIQASHAWLKKSNIHPETEGFIFAIQDRVINRRNYKKHICGLQSIIDKCRICGTEGETMLTHNFFLHRFGSKRI